MTQARARAVSMLPSDPERNIAAYQSQKSMLEKRFLGRWVVFCRERLFSDYDSFEDAAEAAVAEFGDGPFLIRQVGEQRYHLPNSVVFGI